jgi:DNA-binding transcriptional regulator/RsmH inhibitor MraZ
VSVLLEAIKAGMIIIVVSEKRRKMMFYGRWNIKIDEKWRLRIPAIIAKEFNNGLILLYQKEECVILEKVLSFNLINKTVKDFSLVFIIKIKQEKKNKRIMIPEELRASNSFYFGKTITLVGRGSWLEVWPRPSRLRP